MKTSKLIEWLSGYLEKYGDLPVRFCSVEDEDFREIHGVYYTTTEDDEAFISLQNFD